MKLKGLLLTFVVVVGLLFAVLNWQVLFAATAVNLLVATVEAPLGILLLLLAVGLALAFFLAALWERAGQLRQLTHLERINEDLRARLERQRSAELQALDESLRERFDGVRQQLEVDSGRVESNLRESIGGLRNELMERIDLLQERVVLVRNELAADIGELEDRLQRGETSTAPE